MTAAGRPTAGHATQSTCFFSQHRNLLYKERPAMMMNAIAPKDTPNMVWCSLLSWSKTFRLDCVSLSRCLSMVSGECADLCMSAMSACKLSKLDRLFLVSCVAAVDRDANSFLMFSNSSPSLWPVFLSRTSLSSLKSSSITETRFDRVSRDFAICCLTGCVSTTSLKTKFVSSLIASDSALWSLKEDASANTSTLSSGFAATVGAGVVCTSSPADAVSRLITSSPRSSTIGACSALTSGIVSPPKEVKPR
mmetsp:Transcript_23514/g.35186  ORF Transcript_23514/g.35186 Transcript_23514/m.35186 type:complete len:250 (-) Transcript_23514:376-1125(-)